MKTIYPLKPVPLKKPCYNCESSHGYITPSGNKTHSARLSCIECHRYLKWLGKADFERAVKLDLVNYL